MRLYWIALACSSLMVASIARADFYIGAQGSLDLGTANFSTTGSTPSMGTGTNFGGGVYGGMGLIPMFGAELGAYYLTRGFTEQFSSVTGTVTYTLPYIWIPLSATFTPISYVTVLGGLYYASAAGNVGGSSTISTVSAPSGSFSSNNASSSDFGLQAGVRGSYPLVPTVSVVAEARYVLGLTNIATISGTTLNLRDILISAGVSFGL